MDHVTFPVQRRWVMKNVLAAIPAVVFFGVLIAFPGEGNAALIFVIFLVALLGNVIVAMLRLTYFSYALEEKFLLVKQGILRREERHIPYGVIQEITVQRGILDRLLGLASVSILNAAQSGTAVDAYGNNTTMMFGSRVTLRSRNRSQMELIGFKGNMVHIPGLLPRDAELLKAAVLQKMKEHPAEDTGSGL